MFRKSRTRSFWSAGVLLVGLGACAASPKAPRADRVVIYGEQSWYRARPEKEQSWQGVLGRREVTLGPGSRTALRYTLVTSRDSLPVYDPDGRERLKVFVGRQVVAHGKRVDLSREGFGPELWIGSIEPADSSAGKGG